MNYGLPYRGSKNKIVKDIINRLPAGKAFVDLFCGGCAVTHAAMLSGKYKRFIINDAIAMMPNAFRDALNGKFKDEKRVVSREDFHRLKDSDAYVRTCWSFGNNGRSYLLGEENARVKMLACKMIMADDWRERRKLYVEFINLLQQQHTILNISKLSSLEALERLVLIGEIQSNQQENLEVFTGDYQDVPIPENAVVYCDPPYKTTEGYSKKNRMSFDYERFYNWLRTRDFPVYVSEYTMPDDFVCVWMKKKTCAFSKDSNSKKTIEKLFVHEKFKEAVKDELL